ncbi:nitroreductase [Porphyromonas crevioricanis]|uniref:FMN reductase [NAD(P)H] n=2 Tax=Porphyromonas crevioricanis TaxID=393921 RepID=A0A0A2FCV3_9PORP|nr:nitroreductase family protein [Porphyromonas crevioricanis]KGN88828.1 nitroreductase [Porphyromonas crevioricanis]SJZ71812.1 Nitroreductase [Porphyromonas crevioricanis]SQH73546.1 FMN reductase [NAD(P)H] [Porphyromonas crevioricanis]GAD05567.1 nitroreductase family protein [Porphyromonas crevioricanis JCM 15906]GAD07839.1 nitroreductase family protein [Porphyromonas crevioricanis JCM 13913]
MKQDTYIYDLINRRQSDRAYDTRPVDPEVITRIMRAVRLAPSACNSQPWSFVVVTDEAKRHEIASACSSKLLGLNHFSYQAPVHIIVVEDRANFTAAMGNLIKKMHFAHFDIGIALSHLTLAATAEGLGSCILGWIDEKKIRKTLGIPDSKRVLFDVLLGYSTDPSREKRRKGYDDIIHLEKW